MLITLLEGCWEPLRMLFTLIYRVNRVIGSQHPSSRVISSLRSGSQHPSSRVISILSGYQHSPSRVISILNGSKHPSDRVISILSVLMHFSGK